MKPKRGILFRTGKELRDRVNRTGGDDGAGGTDGGAGGQGTPPVAAGA